MNQIEIDGVRVLWVDTPGPLSAVLTFGVGTRDEAFGAIGVTHMLEHLVMGTLPKLHHEHNAHVNVEATEFTATGRPEQIVAFLRTVCGALSDVPTSRLSKEAGVLEAEASHSVHPNAGAMLRARYGAAGGGLANYAGPGFDRLTEAMVREHAARHFVAGNAVLQLSGPPPQGLTLPLPPGPQTPVRSWPTMAQDGPRWVPGDVPGAGIMLRGPIGAAWTVATVLLEERLTDLARHEHGLSYQIGSGSLLAKDGLEDCFVLLDAREGQDAAVARLVWEQVNRLAVDGPTREELDHVVAGFRELTDDPRWPFAAAGMAAHRMLFGLPQVSDQQRLSEITAVDAGDVMACLTAALPTALLVVGCVDTLEIPGVTAGGCQFTRDLPHGRQFAPPMLTRVIAKEARGHRIILTQRGVAHRDNDGDVHIIDFDQVVGVQTGPRQRIVFGLNGCVVPIDLDLFPAAKPVIAAVDATVPAHLHFPASAR